MKSNFGEQDHIECSTESIPSSCARCKYYEDGVRDEYDECCAVCTYMPASHTWMSPYEIIDGIDSSKERMWWCHYNER